MSRIKGPWQIEATVHKYENEWIAVREDRVIKPDGKPGLFATVRMKSGVSVLAMNDSNQVYLTSEYRYAIERESIAVVSGGIDDGELPLVAACRELREELGIEATEWINLGQVDPFTSAIHSPASLFLARKLTMSEAKPESTEVIRGLKVDLSEAVRMVLESEISHGPSCVLILKSHFFLIK